MALLLVAAAVGWVPFPPVALAAAGATLVLAGEILIVLRARARRHPKTNRRHARAKR